MALPRFRPWLSGKHLSTLLRCFLVARNRFHTKVPLRAIAKGLLAAFAKGALEAFEKEPLGAFAKGPLGTFAQKARPGRAREPLSSEFVTNKTVKAGLWP